MPTTCSAGVIEGEKRARWLAFGVAAGGGLLTLFITFYLLRPLARLKQRALQLIAEDADVEAGWPDLGGELGELSQGPAARDARAQGEPGGRPAACSPRCAR